MNRILAALCLIGLPIPVWAGPAVDGSAPNPAVPAVRAAQPPTVDGLLDDPCWKDAPVITGFTHDTRPASLDTEVRVLYGDREAFFAFTCHDPEPARIVAQQRKRNGGMDNDDSIAVGIDPLYDRNSAYWFRVNALGTQGEEIPGGSASKVQWRGDWRAASRITADGWTAELAIPFEILRYPRNQRVFGLMFERVVRRLLEGTNWPIRTFYYVHTNEARWTGVEPPRIQRKPMVMPYVLAATGSIQSSAGLDVKYTAENNATTLLTLRPDFATIEDVVQTIDFSYNPRWLDDRRPFFTEGGGYFGSGYGFYSRSISRVDGGLKSFGKSGPYTYAAMGVSTPHDGSDAIGYLSVDPNPTYGFTGGVVAQRNGPVYDDDGAVIGRTDNFVRHVAGHVWKPLQVNGIGAAFDFFCSTATGSSVENGGRGHAFSAQLNRYGGDGVLEYHARYNEVSPYYTANLAFLPERGYRDIGGDSGIGLRYRRGPVRRAYYWLSAGRTAYWNGGLWHNGGSVGVDADLMGDAHANIGLDMATRRNASTAADAATALTFHDRIANLSFGWRRSDTYRQGDIGARLGRQAGGPYTFVNIHQGVKLTDKLSGGVDASYLRLRGALDDVITQRVLLSALYEITSERSLALRLIGGKDRSRSRDAETSEWDADHTDLTNAYLAYRQELRKGADVFVLAGDPNPATAGIHSQIAIKYVVTL
ncbi:MAG TPA: carbohydrate binding family 9 domain-containing protein [Armatimonadota bacterium]|jgi:hypothetical protein